MEIESMEIVPTEITIVSKCVYTGNSGISLIGENGCSLGGGGRCEEPQSLPNTPWGMEGNFGVREGDVPQGVLCSLMEFKSSLGQHVPRWKGLKQPGVG
jgi:hypothetical protein